MKVLFLSSTWETKTTIVKNVKSIFVGMALSASFAFTGCGNDVTKEVESIADKVCACKDVECADKTMKAINELKGEANMKEIMVAMTKMSDCQATLVVEAAAVVVEKVESIAGRVCTCKDLECAEQAMKAMKKLEQGDKPNEADMKRIDATIETITKCMYELAKSAALAE